MSREVLSVDTENSEIPELVTDAKRALLLFLHTVRRESEGRRASSLSKGVWGRLPPSLGSQSYGVTNSNSLKYQQQ